MNDDSMRESLLRQSASPSVAFQMLYELMEAENRRVRRLTTWTWIVWLAWLVLLALYALLVWSTHSQTRALAGTGGPVTAVVWPIWFVLVPLAAAGLILLVWQLVARRSATVSQLRVSVAAIEAQLNELAATRSARPTQGEQ
jgi:hypothetical protein